MVQRETVWYFARFGRADGPYTTDEFEDLMAGRVILPQTLVWRVGWSEWRLASDAEGEASIEGVDLDAPRVLPPLPGKTAPPQVVARPVQPKPVVVTPALPPVLPPPSELSAAVPGALPAGTTLAGPWIRFVTRVIDLAIGAVLIMIPAILLVALFRALFSLPVWEVAIPIGLFVGLFLRFAGDALVYYAFGTTLGRWLLELTVRDDQGGVLDNRAYAVRNLRVWGFGNAFSIPVVSHLFMLLQLLRTVDGGRTDYDERWRTRVTQSETDPLRVIVAYFLFLLVLTSVFWCTVLLDTVVGGEGVYFRVYSQHSG